MDSGASSEPAPHKKQRSKALKIVYLTLFLLVLIGFAVGIYVYFYYADIYPTTQDAYVHANVLYVNSQVSGQVERVYIHNQQHVKKGQLLFTIKPTSFTVAVNKAKANLKLAERKVKALHAAINVAKANIKERQAHLEDVTARTRRTLDLERNGFVSAQEGLNATTMLNHAKASLALAKAMLHKTTISAGLEGQLNAQIKAATMAVAIAELNHSYTKVSAPSAGSIVNFKLRPNSWVTQGRHAFALIESNTWWIAANYKETILGRIKVGMPATIKVGIYPNTTFKGYVASISSGSDSAFSLLPSENASGNWVQVTQRFSVLIRFDHPEKLLKLRVGASAKVTVNTTKIMKSIPRVQVQK
jgi:membrane fusion protein (multidrug efflux system)